MKIAINASILDEKMDGVRVYAVNAINNVINLKEAKKYEFVIFTPIINYFRESKNVKVVKIPELMINSKYPKISPFFRFFWNNLVYPFLARDFDISYTPSSNGSLFLNNQIITIQDIIMFYKPELYRSRYIYFKYFMPLMLKKARAVIVVSDFLKKEFKKFFKYKKNICVSSESYNESIFNLKLDNKNRREKNYILITGATYPYKNVEKALAAFSSLQGNLKKRYFIVITGISNGYEKELDLIITKLNLNDKVKKIKYSSQKEMSILYKNAVFLIYPSLHESFGLPPLEAMASGCPVTASNIPALKEVCGEAVHYFNPSSTEDIKKAIEELLTRKSLRTNLVKKGIKRCKLFTWEKSAKKILNTIKHSI